MTGHNRSYVGPIAIIYGILNSHRKLYKTFKICLKKPGKSITITVFLHTIILLALVYFHFVLYMQDGFHNAALENRKNLDWDLYHFLHLRVHLPLMDNLPRRSIVEKILNDFESFVQPKIPSFSKGFLHGDANGMNVIVKKNELEEYQIAGLIDFDDSAFSCYVFEIALFLAYTMIENLNPIDGLSPVELVCPMLQGYLEVFPLSSEEISCLYYLVLSRCCQSAVLGEIGYKAEPWNTYLLTTPEKAYKLMDLLLAMGKEKVDKIWSEAILET